METVQTVAVVGAGAAGRAFALRCAQAGFAVVLEDVMPANLRRAQDEYAELQAAAGSMHDAPLGSLRYATTVEDAVREADLAIDFVPDELESKLEIFCLLDRMSPPRTILLTPTRNMSMTDLGSCTYRSERCVGVRGDSLLEGTVDLLRSRFASTDVLEAVARFFVRLGLTALVIDDIEQPMLVKNLSHS